MANRGGQNRLLRIASVAILAGAPVIGILFTSGAIADDGQVSIDADSRFEDQVEEPNYGHPADVEQNYSLYLDSLESVDPAHWGGGYVDGSRLVIVYVAQSESAATTALARAGISGAVQLKLGRISLAAFDSAMAEVTGLGGLDGEISTLAPDYENQQLVVAFLEPDAPEIAQATAGFGSAAAAPDLGAIEEPTVEDLDSIDAAISIPFVATFTNDPAALTSRYYDGSPHYGGAAIKVSASASEAVLCSTAFAWNPPNVASGTTLLTAAHCREEGDGVIRNIVSKYNTDGTTQKIGDIVATSAGANGTFSNLKGDFAVIRLVSGESTSPRVYHGTYDTSTSKSVDTTALALPKGWEETSSSYMYTSGAGPKIGHGDGQARPNHVSNTDVTQTFFKEGGITGKDQNFSGLTVAEAGSDMVQPGDSGGAVYLIKSGLLRPLGIISGNNWVSPFFINGLTYYTPLAIVSTYYGGSVDTQ